MFKCKTFISYSGPTIPPGTMVPTNLNHTMLVGFQANVNFFCTMVLVENIFKDFLYIFPCTALVPYCGITLSLGVMIVTNVKLRHVKKLSCKFQHYYEELEGLFQNYFMIFRVVVLTPGRCQTHIVI